jgi:hypothetical protein
MSADNTPLIPAGAAYFRPTRTDAPTRAFDFLICPSFTLLAFASAVEPLRIANQLSQRPLYAWRTATAERPARHQFLRSDRAGRQRRSARPPAMRRWWSAPGTSPKR